MTISQVISTITDPPDTQDPANFDVRADQLFNVELPQLVSELNIYRTQANSTAVDVNTDALAAAQSVADAAAQVTLATTQAGLAATSATIAQGAANYQGEYSAMVLYDIGESVTYLGDRYIKKSTAAAGTTPVDGADWLQIAGGAVVLNVFSAEASAAIPLAFPALYEEYSIGGIGFDILHLDGLALFAVVNSSGSSIFTSPDGKTWTTRSVGISVNRFAFDGTILLTWAQGSAVIYSSTNAISYAAATSAPAAVSGGAGITGRILLVNNSVNSTAYLTTDGGVSYSTETLPASASNGSMYKLGGRFVFIDNSGNLYHSATGVTGSWTSVAIPRSSGFTGTISVPNITDDAITLKIPNNTLGISEIVAFNSDLTFDTPISIYRNNVFGSYPAIKIASASFVFGVPDNTSTSMSVLGGDGQLYPVLIKTAPTQNTSVVSNSTDYVGLSGSSAIILNKSLTGVFQEI